MDEIKYRTCRTCLKKNIKLLPLLQNADNTKSKRSYGELLKEYAHFEFTNDYEPKMPQSLCTKCCRQISQISKFITQAQACNDKLMIMITSGHIDCLKEEAIDLPTETSIVFDEKLEYDMDVAKEKYDIKAHQSIETLDKNYSVGNWDNKDEVLLLSTLQSDTSHNSVGGSKSYDDKDEVLHFSTLQSDTDGNCVDRLDYSALSNDEAKSTFILNVKCPVCSKSLKRVYLLKHLRKIHNIDQPGNFLKQREQSHEITDGSLNPFFNCSQCDYIAKSKAGINYHNRTKHATEEDKYKCKFCAFISLKKLDLVDHIKNEHKVKFKVLKRSVKKNQNQGEISNHSESDDDSCNDETNLDNLIPSDSSDDNEFIKHMISLDRKILKSRYIDGKPYNSLARKCDECNKVYKDFPSLYAHKRFVHMSEDMYSVCMHCGKKYKRSKDLKNHMSQVHSAEKQTNSEQSSDLQEKRFRCTDCDYATTTTTHLKLHIRRHHTGEKPYVCEICGNSFLTSHDLKKHHYLHTGEKPYKCLICPKTFRVSSKLTKHKRVHTGERPFKCPECGKGFTQEYNLSVHKRIHTK